MYASSSAILVAPTRSGEARLTNNERNHAGAVSSRGFKPLDQLLHLPYLDLLSRNSGVSVCPCRVSWVVRVRKLGRISCARLATGFSGVKEILHSSPPRSTTGRS